jgi:glucose-6-phosphate isomerase
MEKKLMFSEQLAQRWINTTDLEKLHPLVKKAHLLLRNHQGAGAEYTGWIDWPEKYDRDEFNRIREAAELVREKADAFVVIGIGGSYLGARSAIELLQPAFRNQLSPSERSGPEIYFAGNGLSPSYLEDLMRILADKEVYLNVISKSGTTLEPAISFRILRKMLEDRHGKREAARRIIATTDRNKGALRQLAVSAGYKTFNVPDDIGGRYSVLTAVGLLPIAVSGIDLQLIMDGALEASQIYSNCDIRDNDAYRYAAVRNILYRLGKTMEILTAYEPSFIQFIEWWKQLFGESEGKNFKGIFPAGVNFTTDLHSMGQYIQQGLRNFFMTTLWVEKSRSALEVTSLKDNSDGLGIVEGLSLHEINEKACRGTMQAHTEGEVPNLKLILRELTPHTYGMLVYFFELACGISGYLLGVNPFDQPGVEAYKTKVFSLLGLK